MYLGLVQPMALRHSEIYSRLADTSRSLINFIEQNDLYPTEAIIQEMHQLEKDLQSEVTGLLTPLPSSDEEYAGTLEAIFERWAYPSTHSALMKIRHFEGQVRERMGPEQDETASYLAKSLAISFCRSGLFDFEQLGCKLLEDLSLSDENGHVRSFEVSMEFVAS
ncbi:MAG: hypothetical protein ABIK28_17295, partial [Planctomycetota bacterium]